MAADDPTKKDDNIHHADTEDESDPSNSDRAAAFGLAIDSGTVDEGDPDPMNPLGLAGGGTVDDGDPGIGNLQKEGRAILGGSARGGGLSVDAATADDSGASTPAPLHLDNATVDDGEPGGDSLLSAPSALQLENATVDEGDSTPVGSELAGFNLSDGTVDDGDPGAGEILNVSNATMDEGGETSDASSARPSQGLNLSATMDEGAPNTKVSSRTSLHDKTQTGGGWSTGSGSGSRSGLMSSDITSISGRLGDAGTSFAGYTLLERIAEGGMGVVFKARQDALNRIVAVKIMKGGALASEYRRKRFVQEAEAAAALKHTHIVPIHEIAEAAGHPYYVMDYVQGTPIHDTVQKTGMDCDAIAKIMGQISDAVHHFHTRGIIHRDLKPDNILVDAETMEPKVIDFGIAKNLLQSEDKNMTREGAVLGTPHYMSPEQASGSHNEVDTRSDVYALGAIFYELLTGRLPFAGVDPKVLLFTILDKDPPTPIQVKDDLPWELSAIAMKAMEKDRERRYQTALELKDDIRRYLNSEPIEATQASMAYRMAKFVKRRKGLVASTSVVVMVVIGLLGFIVQQRVEAADNDREKTAQIVKESKKALASAKKAEEESKKALASAKEAELAQAGQLIEAKKAQESAKKAEKSAAEAKKNAEEAAKNALKAEAKAKEATAAIAAARESDKGRLIAAAEAQKQAKLAIANAAKAEASALEAAKNAEKAVKAELAATRAKEIAADEEKTKRLVQAKAFFDMPRDNPLAAADNLRDGLNRVRDDDADLRLKIEKAFVDEVINLASQNVKARNTGLAEYWLRQADKMTNAQKAKHKEEEIQGIISTIAELKRGLENIANARAALAAGNLAQAKGELDVAIGKGAEAKDYGSLKDEIMAAASKRAEELVREGRELLRKGEGSAAFAKAQESLQLEADNEPAKLLTQNSASRIALEAQIRANEFGQSVSRQGQAVKELAEAAKLLEKFPSAQKELLVEKTHREQLIADQSLAGYTYIPTIKFTETNAFYMARYEVTNQDYLRFVGDSGYDNEALWDSDFNEEDRKAGLAFWTKRAGNQQIAKQPATHLSWYEARAYALWQTAKAKKDGQNVVYRLPTIKEWEAAAGWNLKDQRPQSYPWGDTFDIDALLLDAKTPVDVGQSPKDKSPFGVYDLGGSVSEWVVTSSKGKKTQALKGADYYASEAHAKEFGRVANLAAPSPNPDVRARMRFGFRLLREIP
jgi:tRNA A-37 threonylcarbamoyl transferase component Bud32